MAIIDINGSEIVWLRNFPNDENVENIEFGSGKSYFGKKYFPLCYLTDITNNQLEHFFGFTDYELQDCHYLDYTCDFNTVDLNGKTFSKVILCNPFFIGFRGREYTKEFLNKAGHILNDLGSIIVIGNSTNGWSKYRNAEKYLGHLTNGGELNYHFAISPLTTLDDRHEYRMTNTFTMTDIKYQTYPDEMFTITKI